MSRYGNGDIYKGRYVTPVSFRRTKESEELHQRLLAVQQERETEESEHEPPNYHQTDNCDNPEEDNMSNQIFGSHPVYNYPSDNKPEPLDGRTLPPRNIRPTSDTPNDRYYQNRGQMYEHQQRQQMPNESPRQQMPNESPRQQMQYESPRHQNQYESPRHQMPNDSHRQQAQYESPRHQMPNDSPRHQLPNDSPRRHMSHETLRDEYIYGQQSYRSGRPDIGFQTNEQTSSVPYPQEPIRRRREYEQPPDIGYGTKFDPHSQPDAPKTHDLTVEDGIGPHPGWVLLLRFHKDGEKDVRRALTMCAKHIDSDGGRILGLAPTGSVHIKEGGDAWVTFGKMRYFGAGKWGVQESPEDERTNYSILALYWPSLSRAIQWFDRDSSFKNKDFPQRYTTDCIALPLNSSVDTKYCKTLVMTEYPKISHPEYFRDKFSIPTEDMMRNRFDATPYVVKTTSIPTDDPRQRVARHLRGSWIKRNSIITISMFKSKREVDRYFLDSEFHKCKDAQDRVSAPTTVVIDLEDWRL